MNVKEALIKTLAENNGEEQLLQNSLESAGMLSGRL